jgi:hypothetical protein
MDEPQKVKKQAVESIISTGLSNDRKICAEYNLRGNSAEEVEKCPSKCPSCDMVSTHSKLAYTLDYLQRNKNLNPSLLDYKLCSTYFSGSDAHSVIPQSLLRNSTRNLLTIFLKKYANSNSPCEFENEDLWKEFCIFYTSEIIRICSEELKSKETEDWIKAKEKKASFRKDLDKNLELLKRWQDRWVKEIDEVEKTGIINVDWKKFGTGPVCLKDLIALYTQDNGQALDIINNSSKYTLKLNDQPLNDKDNPLISLNDFKENKLTIISGTKLLTFQLLPIEPEKKEEKEEKTESSSQYQLTHDAIDTKLIFSNKKQIKNWMKFVDRTPKNLVEPVQVEVKPDSFIFTAKVKPKSDSSSNVNIGNNTYVLHRKVVNQLGKTMVYTKETFIDGISQGSPENMLVGGTKLKAEGWVNQIFSTIMGAPFTKGTQCRYCEEIQGDGTFIQRLKFYNMHKNVPPEFVGIQLLTELKQYPSVEDYIADWLKPILNNLRERIRVECEREKEKEKERKKKPTDDGTKSLVSDREIEDAFNENIKLMLDKYKAGFKIETCIGQLRGYLSKKYTDKRIDITILENKVKELIASNKIFVSDENIIDAFIATKDKMIETYGTGLNLQSCLGMIKKEISIRYPNKPIDMARLQIVVTDLFEKLKKGDTSTKEEVKDSSSSKEERKDD